MIFADYSGKIVQASHQLPYKADYKCPSKYCTNQRLILKKGKKKIPHFDHKAKSICNKYSEPETQAHLVMKLSFQQTLGVPEASVEYGKIRGVRPDLLWRKIRIDFHPQFKNFGFGILLDIKQRIDLLIEFEIVIRKHKRVSNSKELLFTNPKKSRTSFKRSQLILD